MANEKPMGGSHAVALDIPSGNLPFLRRVLTAAQQGLRDDFRRFGDELQQPRSKLLLEDVAYTTLLVALDGHLVVPDDELCAVLSRLAESVDHGNDYARVAFEHDALHNLLAQLEGAAA